MPTKEYIDHAVDTEWGFFFTPSEKCILCDKWSYGEMHVIKLPEWVEMCLDCCDKHPDEFSRWRVVYKIGFGFLNKETHEFI